MDWLGFAVYRSLRFLLSAFPMSVIWRLGRLVGTVGYLVGAPYRKLALHNLGIAFPEKTEAERRALAREHFRSLGANFLCGLKIPSLSKEQLREITEFEGVERVEKLVAAKQGCVMVISHIGNWELFSQLYPVLFDCPLGTIYQRLGNPYLDAEMRTSRARLGVELFERKEGFQGAIKTLRAGGIVGVLIDQHAGDAGLWCPFFGRLASTSSLAAMLALRTGAALVPGAVNSAGPGKWKLVIDEAVPMTTRDTDELTAQMNVALEMQIRRRPADWFWVHNRWKTPKPKFLLSTYKRGITTAGRTLDSADPATRLQPFRLLVRSSNWLGDAVMTIPAVKAAKRGRPDLHLTVLTPGKIADVWRSVREVDEVICIEPKEKVFDVAKKIRGRFDAALILPNSLRTGLEVWLAGIPRRVGTPGHSRKWLLDQPYVEKKKKKVSEPPKHQVYHYLAMAKFIGAETSKEDLIFTPNVPARTGGAPVIGLCPGAEYGPAKRWLPERFAEVMKALHASTGCEWKLFGVAKDRPVADEILAAANTPATDLIGKTSLAGLIAELKTCDVLVTNDTGTMHLAASLGVPTVSIFGSTEPVLTGPLGSGHRVIRHHVDCSPCFLRECPLDFRCMKAVEAPEVIRHVESVLAERAVRG